jgi:transcription antitermination factor NusG
MAGEHSPWGARSFRREALEQFVYPPDVLTSDDYRNCGNRSWWLVYTRPRHEKAIAATLLPQQVPLYLPIIRKNSYLRRRVKSSLVPLFPGYLFIHGSDNERIAAMRTNRVSRIERIVDAARLRKDLHRMASLIATDMPMTPEARLGPGDPVRVRSGPLRGIEGVVIRRNRRTRLLVAVDYLRQGASVEIDDFMLEAV